MLTLLQDRRHRWQGDYALVEASGVAGPDGVMALGVSGVARRSDMIMVNGVPQLNGAVIMGSVTQVMMT